MFSVDASSNTTHYTLRNHFKDENIFLEIVDSLLGIMGASSDSDHKRATHRAKDYFVEGGKLWRLGGPTPSRAVSRCECVTRLEATQLTREEHAKLHMGCDVIKMQLLDKSCSPLLDASILMLSYDEEPCLSPAGGWLFTIVYPKADINLVLTHSLLYH
jgi:hypothetical protein